MAPRGRRPRQQARCAAATPREGGVGAVADAPAQTVPAEKKMCARERATLQSGAVFCAFMLSSLALVQHLVQRRL